MARRYVLAGNWKMNKTPAEAEQLAGILAGALPETAHVVAVFPPFLAIERVAKAANGRFLVGAQNCHFEAQGAYTGEISPPMLREAGARAVLIGHSERRQYFAETDQTVNKKVKAAFAASLQPFVCVGETLAQREAGGYLDLVREQLRAALAGLSAQEAGGVVVAYEPVWAIGTGVTASAGQAQEVCACLRALLADLYGRQGGEIPVLYGGSMNASNAAELLSMPDIDGGLIGGASLKPAEFAAMVACANSLV